MKVFAISVGQPRDVEWNGKTVQTSIFKTQVSGPVHLSKLNLDGDRQSDLTVHGGFDKAVYAYPSEHYAFWKKELPGVDLPWGSFGENLATEGLLEDQVSIGDRFKIGSTELIVTQPRMPCFKLGIKFGDPRMIKRFLQSRRTGFYFRVLKEGELSAGDSIEPAGREDAGVTVRDVTDLYAAPPPNPELLRRAIATPALPMSWREYFKKQLTPA